MGIMTPAEPGAELGAMKFLHERLIFRRRARVLAAFLAKAVPAGATVLDAGCGNGVVSHLLRQIAPSLSIQGLEVMPRPSCLIQCAVFDGVTIPLPNDSIDVCMFVDVLHHTLNIEELLKEARRVARKYILIKDHLCRNRLDRAVLKFMDWVGNRAYGVRLVYNYKTRKEWDRIFSSCGLRIASWNSRLPLYPPPFNWLFGRRLHFLSLLEKG